MIVNPSPDWNVAAPRSRFADNRGALQHFQIVAELLSAGKSCGTCQYISGLVRQLVLPTSRRRPGLLSRILPAIVHVVQMRRTVEQVAGNQRDHFGIASGIVAQ